MIMKNRVALTLVAAVAALLPGCIEYEVEEIKPTVTPGPAHVPDDLVLDFPFHKQFEAPDEPYDLGDPLLPDIEVSFIQHDFGTHELSDPPVSVGLEIRNVGDYPLEIANISQATVSNSFILSPLSNSKLWPGEIGNLDITYDGTKYGPDGDMIKIESNDPDEPSVLVMLAANGATPTLEINPPSVDFGSVDPLDGPVATTIDLTNVGDGVLEISKIEELKLNQDIGVTTYPATKLTPGQTTSMAVFYYPSDSGNDTEKIKLTSNDPANPAQKVTIKGKSADPDIDAPPQIDFGTLEVGSSLVKTVDIENIGDGKLQISNISFPQSTPTFSIVKGFLGDILPGTSESIELEYIPDDYNLDISSLQIMSNDPVDHTYTISLIGDVGVPEIEVDPLSVDFGNVNVYGAPATEKVRVSNIGTGTLILGPVSLKNGAPYSWSLVGNTIAPGASEDIDVTYSPISHSPSLDELVIGSNDPHTPSVSVPLSGHGSAPQLEISPDPYDFGVGYLECDLEQTIDLKNTGDADLEISKIEYFTSFPSHFTIDYDHVVNGQLPWTIAPGSFNTVYVEYLPTDVTSDSSFIKVHSNDPVDPQKLSYQYGQGDYYSSVMDTYSQNTVMMSDILFVIDNSCSMSSWQAHVATNFDSFITVFQNSGVDYHIAVITTDDPSFVGSTIDNSTIDPIAEFTLQAQVGNYGSGFEQGLDMAYAALQPGGDAAPGSTFERADAKMSLIFVSDEPDYSWDLPFALDYSSYFKSVKSNSSKIVAHAVSGDCPSGCSMPYTSSAGFTYSKYAHCNQNYLDVVNDMGGTQLSLCDTDWGLKMETLAKDSIVKSSFELSEYPIVSTIEVFVNGVATGNWTYDSLSNEVAFDPAYVPVAGSVIDISYNISGGC
jgi:hypothetical protein